MNPMIRALTQLVATAIDNCSVVYLPSNSISSTSPLRPPPTPPLRRAALSWSKASRPLLILAPLFLTSWVNCSINTFGSLSPHCLCFPCVIFCRNSDAYRTLTWLLASQRLDRMFQPQYGSRSPTQVEQLTATEQRCSGSCSSSSPVVTISWPSTNFSPGKLWNSEYQN